MRHVTFTGARYTQPFFASRELWEAKARSLLRRGLRTKASRATSEPIRPRRDDQSPMGAPDCLSERRFLRRDEVRMAARRPGSQGAKGPRTSAARSGSTGSSSSSSRILAPSPARRQDQRCQNREDIEPAKGTSRTLAPTFGDIDAHDVEARRASDRTRNGMKNPSAIAVDVRPMETGVFGHHTGKHPQRPLGTRREIARDVLWSLSGPCRSADPGRVFTRHARSWLSLA
ncbi:hypothetical protein ACVI1J_009149 [Bradyrhizobium diazoefficiens]